MVLIPSKGGALELRTCQVTGAELSSAPHPDLTDPELHTVLTAYRAHLPDC